MAADRGGPGHLSDGAAEVVGERLDEHGAHSLAPIGVGHPDQLDPRPYSVVRIAERRLVDEVPGPVIVGVMGRLVADHVPVRLQQVRPGVVFGFLWLAEVGSGREVAVVLPLWHLRHLVGEPAPRHGGLGRYHGQVSQPVEVLRHLHAERPRRVVVGVLTAAVAVLAPEPAPAVMIEGKPRQMEPDRRGALTEVLIASSDSGPVGCVVRFDMTAPPNRILLGKHFP